MDPITARRVLRIFPDAPLTVDLIERAHAGELAARHPSLYPDGPERARAEEWARTLDAARTALLAHVHSGAGQPAAPPVAPVVAPVEAPTASAPPLGASMQATPVTPPASGDLAAAVNAPHRRGLSRGAIIGIVAGSVALVVFVGLAVFGVASLVQTVGEATETFESELATDPNVDGGSSDDEAAAQGDDTQLADVERHTADETFFRFPAAMELYNDGRYNDDCPIEYVEGCWQSALITESDCDALQVELGFSNDPDSWAPEHVENLDISNVVAGATTPVVFGHDDYDTGWINDVRCLDPAD